jgi:hypothetical protein
MTEQEWLACTDPGQMLEALGGKASERKLRLFSCACCRRVWHLLIDERSRTAVEVAEAWADGLVEFEVAQAAFRNACVAQAEVQRGPAGWPETVLRFRRPRDRERVSRAAFLAAFSVGEGVGHLEPHFRGETAAFLIGSEQTDLVRCLFSNPARVAVFLPSWRQWKGGLVVAMAQRIYDTRDFGELPILGDALEDAGCSDQALLDHLRGPGPHARGCWGLDLLLGKI